MTTKKFKLGSHEIKPIVAAMGGCIATDRITVEGYPVRFMYREEPDNELDSGWRFFSGFEDDAYMADPAFHQIYDVNTIANYDPSITPFLAAPSGSAFERPDHLEQFVLVTDWNPGEE
jgi:hypothetical protein